MFCMELPKPRDADSTENSASGNCSPPGDPPVPSSLRLLSASCERAVDPDCLCVSL